MEAISDISGYIYKDAAANNSHGYLVPALDEILRAHYPAAEGISVFDLGCGNGVVANHVASQGYKVAGVDPSTEGILQAGLSYPHVRLETGSAYDDLREIYGQYDAVYSLEVVEHVYSPRKYATTLFELTRPGGIAIISTPYHGYFKNLALAATGKMERHFTALWDHGHIKFWSVKTLGTLLHEAGFRHLKFQRVGRVPVLAKSMIAIGRRPSV